MSDIYEAHKRAFANVEAFIVLKDGERVATIAFKYGASVTAFVHWAGLEMTKGRAGGGGYDRKSAACIDAARKIVTGKEYTFDRDPDGRVAFCKALDEGDRGAGWERALSNAGFTVLQAV